MPCNCGGSQQQAQQPRQPGGRRAAQQPTVPATMSKDYYYTGPKREKNGPPAKP